MFNRGRKIKDRTVKAASPFIINVVVSWENDRLGVKLHQLKINQKYNLYLFSHT